MAPWGLFPARLLLKYARAVLRPGRDKVGDEQRLRSTRCFPVIIRWVMSERGILTFPVIILHMHLRWCSGSGDHRQGEWCAGPRARHGRLRDMQLLRQHVRQVDVVLGDDGVVLRLGHAARTVARDFWISIKYRLS